MCAQAQLQDKRGLISLSPCHTVTVNNAAQIEFVCTSTNPKQAPLVVTLSAIAWKKLQGPVKDKINQHLQDKTVMEEFPYHPRSKFVSVKHMEFGSQVALLTYGRKGFLQHENSIYLNDKEWHALEQNMNQLNEWMDAVFTAHEEERQRKKTPTNEVSTSRGPSKVTVYQWKYAGFEEGAPPPQCDFYYFTKDHAQEKAEDVANTLREPLGELSIVESSRDAPQALSFFMLLYFSILYKGTTIFNQLMCPGCRSGMKMTDNLHLSYQGCKCFGRDAVKDYLSAVKKIIPDDFYKDVFYKCWSRLNLPAVNATHLLETLQTVLSSKVLVYLEERVEDISVDYPDMPECLLIRDMMDMNVLMSCLQASLPTSTRQKVELPELPKTEEDE